MNKRAIKQLKMVIFDVDGALAKTKGNSHRVAFNCAFKDTALDGLCSEELYGQLLAVIGGKECIRYFLKDVHTGFNKRDQVSSLMTVLHREKINIMSR